MRASVKWCGKETFLGQSNSGHSIVMDGNGGEKAPSPMEMVLMGAGGCSSVDVVAALKAANQAVSYCEAELTAERREQAPRLFTQINIHFVVTGTALDEALVASAVKDSLEKYCSVCLMLGASIEMTHSYEVREAA
ncbi:osmotically inducible protein OsmC [Enterovibrio norvegicus FF-33]|uniref:Osmotically inducible protein OsmC n=1 Tax=Enterovibrio norvegicus FF-454 TaxID=1185651 RepID=A0A1E5CG33_9GAMM|nr:OsmC family protein [Enterovibrio norvegicus]OEE64470.1 osmotically inducible protein OsmC [Enterovibrio norvegicus FF-454]OEE68858.1 osmotically inducible protein OsmC [Enterovibrio norvegicus FF-33]OEE84911.1 osmotically inducible protein OsmC [Enterovibrio norvegicus FF-162]